MVEHTLLYIMSKVSSLARYLKLDIQVCSNNFEKVYKASDLQLDNNIPKDIFWHEIYLPSLNDNQTEFLERYIHTNLYTPILLTSFIGDKSSYILYKLTHIIISNSSQFIID